MDFKLIKSLDELKAYEREQGYRGHEESWLDDMSGSPLPKDDEYPILICTTEIGDTYNGVTRYFRAIFTPDMAWTLISEMKIMDADLSFK